MASTLGSLLFPNKQEPPMPTISMFYGLIIRMFFTDIQQHNLPYLHVEYQGAEAVVSIPDGEIVQGVLPPKKIENASGMDSNT